MLREVVLKSSSISDFDTEVRFAVAMARADGIGLIRFVLPCGEDAPDYARIRTCLYRVLRTLVKGSTIQFIVTDEDIEQGSTAAAFLLNKYGECVVGSPKDRTYTYVKI